MVSPSPRRTAWIVPAIAVFFLIGSVDLAGAKGIARRPQKQLCVEPHRGNDLLALVTKKVGLQKRYQPKDLVRIPRRWMMPRRKGKLRRVAAKKLRQLLVAAKEDGHELRVRSSYRSYRRQRRVHKQKARKYGERRAKKLSAEAGHSQHQLGTTVDLTTATLDWRLSPRLGKRPEGKWLEEHAHEYGFVMSYPAGSYRKTGYRYEPWHYRYIGVEAAKELHSQDLLLDEYLQACQRCSRSLRCPH